MNRISSILASVGTCAVLLTFFICAGGVTAGTKPPDTRTMELSAREKAHVRKVIYEIGILTSGTPEPGMTRNYGRVVLDEEISVIHRLKPIATLKLLLEITQGGRPEDALTSLTYAVALEDSPRAAYLYATLRADMVDAVTDGVQHTSRDRFTEMVKSYISKKSAK